MITIEVNDTVAMAKLTRLPVDARARLRDVIIKDGHELASLVRQKLSGGVLNVRSGRLLASIKNEMVENPTELYGRVYSEGVPYARIQEMGGQTRAHMIYPVRAQALHFFIGDKEVFAKAVNHPGSKIPARSYLRSSLAEMRDAIISDLKAAVGVQ